MKDRRAGFTLLETLIAALILFSVLAVMTEVLRTSLRSSVTAEASLALSEAAAALRPQITDTLRNQDPRQNLHEGDGVYNGLSFRWSADKINEGRTLTIVESEVASAADQGRPVFLWSVELIVNSGGRERRFAFTELSWQ
jgi:type II secretory pathway pseudopilin PulG